MSAINIGEIVKAVGLKGVCRVYSNTDFLDERFAKGNQLHLKDGSKLTIEKATFKGNMVNLKFVEINSIEEAQKLRNQSLFVDEEELHELEDDEFYFFQLKGCQVYEGDKLLGEVTEVVDTPAHPLIRIESEGDSFLVPFVKSFILNVDLEDSKIDVQLIEGLK